MKKLVTLCLISSLLLAFGAGCTSKENDDTAEKTNTDEDVASENNAENNAEKTDESNGPRAYTEEETLYIYAMGGQDYIDEQFEKKPDAKCIIVMEGATSIPTTAFFNRTFIEKVVIPEGVTEFKERSGDSGGEIRGVFADCKSLREVILPSSFKSFNTGAFLRCTSLERIIVDENNPNFTNDEYGVLYNKDKTNLLMIPEGLKVSSYTVADGVVFINDFSNQFIEEITIPASVSSLSFGECTSLKKITVDENNPNYSSDEYGVLYNKDKTELLYCPTALNVSSYAFADGVDSIKEFSNKFIEELTIPASLNSLDLRWDFDCPSLKRITVDENNHNYTSDEYGVLFNKDKTELLHYPQAIELSTYTIPDGVKEVGRFKNCTFLKKVVFPDGVTYANGFECCTALEEVVLPNNIQYYPGGDLMDCIPETGFFGGCTSLKTVVIPEGVKCIGAYMFAGCTSLEEIEIPDSVTKIEFGAFEGCLSLKNIYIPAKVSGIYEGWFKGCKSLERIIVDEENRTYSSDEYGALYYNDKYNDYKKTKLYCFPANANFTSYIMPYTVKSIDSYAFCDNSKLEEISISYGVSSIYDNVFYNCTALKKIEIPHSIEKIAYNAFKGCTALADVSIPNSVTSIGDKAFADCTSLTAIYIPSNVTYVFDEVFSGCTSLKKVSISNSATNIGAGVFEGCTSLSEVEWGGTNYSIDKYGNIIE